MLQRRHVIEMNLGGKNIVAWQTAGTSSALSDTKVAGGPDVGTTGVFDPVIDGQGLHFEAVTGGFRDRETRSTWDILGRATSGPLAGRALTPVAHVDTFWFAWAAFRPSTRIVSN
ncbi:MAG: hypothetical protein NVS3B21_34430 [Acidimicrobiales bacterium]